MKSKERFGILSKVIARAWKDSAYKKKLMENPTAVLKEAGVDIASHTTITILENTKERHFFVFPDKNDGEMSEEDLMVSGGAGTGGNY